MLKSFTALLALTVVVTTAFAFTHTEAIDAAPLPPDAGVATDSTSSPQATPAVVATPAQQPAPTTPVRLSIPSINLNDKIVPVGLTAKGAMDVPSGSTSNVGWYKDGIIPGDVGSAVLDAHVFAAFSKLKNVKVGSAIFVTDVAGVQRKFIVQASTLYKLSELTPDMLFTKNDARRLNLITCAGQLTADHSTYDHRLVIYATLAE